jgi:hypothetical protein
MFAQSFYGALRGSIKDANSAVMVDVKVTLIDEGTAVSRSTLTNAQGEYVFSSVTPATYTLEAEFAGFKRFTRAGIVIATQQSITFDVHMELGAVYQSVDVVGEVPLIDNSTASTGQVLDNQKLADLPNLGRNPFMLSKVAQNVVPVGNPGFNRMQDQSGSSQISIAGGPVRGNNYLLDGVPITDSTNRAVIIPSLEAVQEVKVQANTYDAEMGRTGGGVFNTFLKSGTNALHGSAFGYIRQTGWLANTFFNNRNGKERAPQPFRNYGASIGGPVVIPKVYNGRNKTFFWIAGEAYRMTTSYSSERSVPTAAEIEGNFSASMRSGGGLQTIYDPLTTTSNGAGGYTRSPFPGNIIPSDRINRVGYNIARTYPAPTKDAAFFGAPNYAATALLADRADQLTGKFDHEFAQWWRASLSYLHYGSREPGEFNFPTVSSPNQSLLFRKVDSTQLNNIFVLSPRSVLTVRYGFNRFPNTTITGSQGYDVAGLGFANDFVKDIQRPQFPVVTMQALQSLSSNASSYNVFHSKSFLVGNSIFIGRHSLKLGFDYRRINIDGINYGASAGTFTFNDVFTRATPATATAGTGADLAGLLLGAPWVAQGIYASELGQYVNYYAGYFHDDFRVNSKLTLNLGVRYEWETGLTGKDNALIVGFDRTVASPLPSSIPLSGGVMYAGTGGYPTSAGSPNRNKISPRLGIAYQINEKTSVRGGYGIFWAPIPYSLQNTLGYTATTSPVATNDGGATPAINLSNPFPGGLAKPAGNALGLLAGVGQPVSVLDQFSRSPMIHQYSFDIQRQLPGSMVVALAFVGSTSRRLVLGQGDININQLDPSYFSMGNDLRAIVANPYYAPGGPGLVGAATITRSQLLRPFPQFAEVNLVNNDQNKADYRSMVVKVEKRMTRGLGFVSTWTWSRNMDGSFGGVGNFFNTDGGVQNIYDLGAEYSLSAFHTPHRWASTFTWELPFGKGHAIAAGKVADYLAGGWSVNAVAVYQSGFPLAIEQNSNNNSIIGASAQRPNATGSSPVTSGSLMERIDGYINRAAFSDAAPFTFGNVSRTIAMRGPGQSNWDLSLFKTFAFGELLKAQFRAEALNAFNTPLFRGPNVAFGNASFGKITSQANFPRFIQLGLRFSW